MKNTEFIEKLKRIRDVHMDMLKNIMYSNLLRFEPRLFYNDLFDKCFENQEDFENVANIAMQMENKKKEQLSDILQFLVNVSYNYASKC